MYKVVNEQERLNGFNFPNLSSNLGIIRLAMGVRSIRMRIRRELFKSKLINNFAHSVTVKH